MPWYQHGSGTPTGSAPGARTVVWLHSTQRARRCARPASVLRGVCNRWWEGSSVGSISVRWGVRSRLPLPSLDGLCKVTLHWAFLLVLLFPGMLVFPRCLPYCRTGGRLHCSGCFSLETMFGLFTLVGQSPWLVLGVSPLLSAKTEQIL